MVIGGGIVGLAAARAILLRRPGSSLVLLEKEPAVATHQSGRNSGVIHSGIYYPPGSAKAELVARGRILLEEFCAEHGIAREYCGKVIVATSVPELARLSRLDELARGHRLRTRRLDPHELAEIEPHARGVGALHLPDTGIVDYGVVARALAEDVRALGGEVNLDTEVSSVRLQQSGVVVVSGDEAWHAARVVNCAGLHADRLARLTGPVEVRITPFRGEYHELQPAARGLVRNLIYPVPDPAFPFLGVHFTRSIHGGVHAGPNAVLALSREGYGWRDVDLVDVSEMIRDRGLRRLARRYWRTGTGEIRRSVSRRAFVRALQKLVPEISHADLSPAPAGVRAQALRSDGTLVEDFAFAEHGDVLHVLNAPSPAATASLAIGEHIATRTTS